MSWEARHRARGGGGIVRHQRQSPTRTRRKEEEAPDGWASAAAGPLRDGRRGAQRDLGRALGWAARRKAKPRGVKRADTEKRKRSKPERKQATRVDWASRPETGKEEKNLFFLF